jgi:protein-S-isoprenylcysteine O-methyltransferase Ste14
VINSLIWLDRFLGFFCLIAFVWAAIFHFKHPKYFDPRKTVISLSATFSTALHSYFFVVSSPTDVFTLIVTLLLLLCSSCLFIFATLVSRKTLDFAFSISKPVVVIKSGAYRFVRHPFYVAYSLTWLAALIFSRSLLSLGFNIWMFYLYYSAARYEERTMLASDVATDYSIYQEKTKMFIPFLI